jgi:hypothetical protein
MKRRYILGGAIAATVLAGGGVGLDAAPSGQGGPSSAVYGAAPAAATGVGAAALAPGTALVDGTGHAVYLFEADAGTTSTCAGPCAPRTGRAAFTPAPRDLAPRPPDGCGPRSACRGAGPATTQLGVRGFHTQQRALLRRRPGLLALLPVINAPTAILAGTRAPRPRPGPFTSAPRSLPAVGAQGPPDPGAHPRRRSPARSRGRPRSAVDAPAAACGG